MMSLAYTLTLRMLERGASPHCSVWTRAEARRQGHATRLLLLAPDALHTAGCDWSVLVATDEGRPLYERAGSQG